MTRSRHSIIESLGVYLPPTAVTTAELLRGCTKEVSFPLEHLTGIVSRRVAGPAEFSIDIARQAVANCLAQSAFGPTDIDLVVACNISRLDGPNCVSFEPGTSLRIRREFGFSNALTFDIANACAGMFTGIWVATNLIDAGIIRRALVFSGEYISHLSRTAQREIDGYLDPRLACLTVGDAGAAVILQPAPDANVGWLALDILTLGKYSSVCIAKPSDRGHGGATMLTDPLQAASLGLEPAASHAARMLRESATALSSLQHIIPHQISTVSINEGIDEIGKRFNVDLRQRVVNNLAQRGNTASNTHFVALHDQILNGRIKSGDGVLCCIAGSGISVGTALYRFDDLPDRLRQAQGRASRCSRAAMPHPEVGRHFVHTASTRVCIEAVGHSRPVLGAGPADTRALAAQAAADCLRHSTFAPRDIQLLLSTGVYRSGFLAEPAAAAMVADDLQMNHDHDAQDARRTFAFDLLNGPVGHLNACHIAAELLRANQYRNAMVVAAECQHASPAGQAETGKLFQVGSALILSRARDGQTGFGRFVFRYFTEYVDALQAYAAQEDGRTFLITKRSQHAESYLLQCIRETVDELLAAEHLSLQQIQHVVLPQISSQFLARGARILGVPPASLIDLTGNGDPFTSTMPCAWEHVRDQRGMKRGDTLLLVSAGAGIQVGCALYYC
jgi:3-oxoacyl-[acyl-carrier-protein] synthase III